MAELYHEFRIEITSFYYSPPDPSAGVMREDIYIEEVDIYDGDVQIKNDDLEAYFIKNHQEELIEALKEDGETDNLILTLH
jgi:hypothetical protein